MKITTTLKRSSSRESGDMIISYITNHPQGAITTLTKAGTPQSSVVNLLLMEQFRFAFMTKRSTRKFKNLKNDSRISFVTYDPISRTEVEIEGIAELVTNKKEDEQIIEAMAMDAQNGRGHISPYVSDLDDYALFVIYPYVIHMTTYWETAKGVEAFHETVEFNVNATS